MRYRLFLAAFLGVLATACTFAPTGPIEPGAGAPLLDGESVQDSTGRGPHGSGTGG